MKFYIIEHQTDSHCYSFVAKTKKECLDFLKNMADYEKKSFVHSGEVVDTSLPYEEWKYVKDYWRIDQVEIIYEDIFDFLVQVRFSEGCYDTLKSWKYTEKDLTK